MLTTEDHMKEGDGVGLFPPDVGFNAQLAKALEQIGYRSGAWTPENTSRSYSKLVIAPHPLLSGIWPSTFSLEDERRQAELFQQNSPQASLIWVLPTTLPRPLLDELTQAFPLATYILCPPLFGFGDAGLMDAALHRLQHQPSSLWKPLSPERRELPSGLLFMKDAVALLVALLQRPPSPHLYWHIPATTHSLEEWRQAFVTAFEPYPPSLKSLWTQIWKRMPDLGDTLHAEAHGTQKILQEPWKNLLEILPSPLTPLPRLMKTAARLRTHHPELTTHFPPRRSL